MDILEEGAALLKRLEMQPRNRTVRVGATAVLVKEAADGSVTISGIASTGTVDRMGDIVEPMGAKIALPIPFLLSHDHAQPLGNVTRAAATSAGIEVTAKAYKGVSDRIDEALRLIALGMFGGLSIGFRALKSEALPGRGAGWRFTEWELLEVSAVTVPANPDARITAAKRFEPVRIKSPGRVAIIGRFLQ